MVRDDEPAGLSSAWCPGSYDPVTLGHVDIITRTAEVFDHVIVGVVNASVRKTKSVFSVEERVAFVEAEIADLGNVEVKDFSNLLVEFARENGAKAVVKGLRAISDFEYEFEMNQLNRKMAPDIEIDVPDGGTRVQFPVLQRRQGDCNVWWRPDRTGPSAR